MIAVIEIRWVGPGVFALSTLFYLPISGLSPRGWTVVRDGRSSGTKGGVVRATVREIHAYPLRPEGYAEPLFHDRGSRKEILEHLLQSEWLFRASEARRPKARYEGKPAGEASVLASWREVDRWWEEDGGVDLIWRRIQTRAGPQEVRAESGRPDSVIQPASAA